MTQKEILRTVDHTLLKQTATPDQIRALIDDAARFETASVCIPPCYVREAAAYAAGHVPVCTVTGFPNGNSTTETKVFETGDAIDNGAEEIDMVINLGLVKPAGTTRCCARSTPSSGPAADISSRSSSRPAC